MYLSRKLVLRSLFVIQCQLEAAVLVLFIGHQHFCNTTYLEQIDHIFRKLHELPGSTGDQPCTSTQKVPSDAVQKCFHKTLKVPNILSWALQSHYPSKKYQLFKTNTFKLSLFSQLLIAIKMISINTILSPITEHIQL